ncbi:MAG: hypothetical protein IPL18_11390 [Sphingomonadales bacterium]|nr:hypothetical protein [Sphingomonadales bacterium]
MKKLLLSLGLTAIALSSVPAHAQSFIFHLDGEAGNRQAYFSKLGVTDRTPPSIEIQPFEIKELTVAIVYENAQEPELAELLLQFECPSQMYLSGKKKKAPKQPGWNDPVKVKVAQGSSILRRSDLKNEDIPAGEWEMRADLAMLTAQKLACNDLEIERTIRATGPGSNLDQKAVLKEKMASLGIIHGYALTDLLIWTEYLDFAWNTIWKGAQRPDPSGKWSRQSTPEELAEAQRKMAAINQQLADLTAKTKNAYEPKIKEAEVGFAFDKAAAKVRGDRKPRGWVAEMLLAWQGKTEDQVAARMGRPYITEAGDLRFLSYGQQFDNRVVVGDSTGATWEEGLATSCDIQFVTIPDDNGVRRVADIRLSVDSTNIMATNSNIACSDLKQAPGD